MKKQKHSETQIANTIKEYESSKSAGGLCRELDSQGHILLLEKEVFRDGKPESKTFKELEEENRKLKHLYVELALETELYKMFSQKSGKAF